MREGDAETVAVRPKWFRFGIALAILYTTLTIGAALLLRIDQRFGLLAVLVGSVLGGWILMIYLLYYE